MSAAAPTNVADIYPLSPAQQGMLFHTLYAPEAGMYRDQLVCRLEASPGVDLEAFQGAWREVVARHPILRTAFVWERRDTPLQIVLRQAQPPFAHQDWRGLPPAEQEERWEDLLRTAKDEGFDLARPPLFRLALVRFSERAFRLVLDYHHMLMDAWSVPIVFSEVLAFYEARRRGERPALGMPRPFRDYIAWLRQQDGQRAETFWRGLLQGYTAPLALPILRQPPAVAADVAQVQRRLSAASTAALTELARSQRLTLSTLVQGAWAMLLSRYCGREDVVYGTVVSGRPEALAGIGSMVGSFINTLPVRVTVAPAAPALDWLRTFQERLAELRSYEYSSLVEVQGWSEMPRGVPLFETILAFENTPVDASLRRPGGSLEIRQAHYDSRSNYPLSLTATPGPELVLRAFHDARRVEGSAVARLLEHLRTILESLAAAGDGRLEDLAMLTAVERQQLREWNDRQESYPSGLSLHGLFELQADRAPDAVALVGEEGSLTYRELDDRADALARRLRRLVSGADARIGVCAERSLEMVVALLGVLKAGGAYVPLDPRYPRRRLAGMLGEAGIELLLIQERLLAALPESALAVLLLDGAAAPSEPTGRLAPEISPDSLAYVIFTSGSTGRPKGVMNSHRGIVNRLLWMQGAYGLGPEDRVLQKTPFSFDVSVWEFFWPLLAGARLVVARPEGHQDPAYLAGLIAEAGITTVHFVPSMLRVFLEEPGAALCTSLRRVIVSGEALPAELRDRFFQRLPVGVELHNLYGPTEAAVDVTFEPCLAGRGEAGVAIGRPVANTRIHVLSQEMRPVPVGVGGELHIGGVQLARGYLGRPELTAELFVPDPWSEEPGGRLYKTGDLSRHLPDGRIEFLGRLDHQVKVRGFRIELGEIEACLLGHRGVRATVVLAREDAPGDVRLVAYVVPAAEPAPAPAELRALAGESLPAYMVPADFVLLDSLPTTPNGKLDRRALPSPSCGGSSATGDFVAPRTPIEEALAGIWAEVLGRERVGAGDEFVALGGHSLLATQVISRIREALGVELPLRSLFEESSLANLARAVARAMEERRGAATPPILPGARPAREIPLSYAQQRLWFLWQLAPRESSYNVPLALLLTGDLDRLALARGLGELLRRHEVLRTTFPAVDGRPFQLVELFAPPSLACVDLVSLPAAAREAEARRLSAEEGRQPFDLAIGPLLRSRLLRLTASEHLLLLTLHHVAFDGWSGGVLLDELANLYEAFARGEPSPLPELPIQYADFAVWQRRSLEGPVLEELLQYWTRQLAGVPPLELPLDHPRPAVPSSEGDTERLRVPRALTDGLKGVVRREGVTLFVLLLAAYEATLHYFSGQADMAVGTDFAARSRLELEPLIGFFVNQVVLRTNLSGDPTFRQLLKRANETLLGAYSHQELPFDRLVEALRPGRELGITPLYQAKLILQNVPFNPRVIRGIEMKFSPPVQHDVKFDLLLNIWENPEGLSLAQEYRRELFEAATIRRLLAHLHLVLQQVAADPEIRLSRLNLLLGEADRQRHEAEEETLKQVRLTKLQTVKRRAMNQ
jgi:amino acid adenylation domain-containing protein